MPKLLPLEADARAQGFQNIAGVDEVGRGCLAGPVVAAAVIFPSDFFHEGIQDSKLLTSEQREAIFPLIMEKGVACGFGVVEPGEIDVMNIARASLKAMRLAVEALTIKPDFLLIDGRQTVPLLPIRQKPVVKGDRLCLSIAAASIIAKVHRDRLMTALSEQYPQFRFEKHKGYGTKEHRDALEKYGPTPIHRTSFHGVQKDLLRL